ncbi:flagellum-associated coiled-coil domain-containing protein 1 [Pelodytes ibericus]
MSDFNLTSQDVYSAFRDPARESQSAKPSSNPRKWGFPRLSGSRMMHKDEAKSEKEYLVISSGYSMIRSKGHIAVRLEEEFFGGAKPPVEEKLTPLRNSIRRFAKAVVFTEDAPTLIPSKSGWSCNRNNVKTGFPATGQKPEKKEHSFMEREDIIKDLQEQIATLTSLLEQEANDHQKTQRRLTQELEDKITELQNENEEEIRNLQKKHADELLALQQEDCAKLEQEKAKSETKFEELQKEFDLLKSSFRTYQESLMEEMNEMWIQKEAKWKETFENETLKEMGKQKQSLRDEFEGEKRELQKRNQEEMSMVQQSYEKQMEESWKKYKEVLQESKMQDMLKMHLQAEIAEKKETITSLNVEIQQAHVQMGKLKSQIEDLRRNLDNRVSKVEAKYNHRIHSLLNENADLRRRLISKNEQLFSEKHQQ